MTWSLTARWIVPIDQPPIERGVLVIQGDRIAALEPRGRRWPDVDLGEVAVLPGLVNTHTHLDLSGMRGLALPSPDFTNWLRQVIAHRRSRSPEQVQADIAAGLAECLRTGTTLVGDISGDGGSWEALARSACRATVFREMLGLSETRAQQALDDACVWANSRPVSDHCRPALSPHAPYSVRVHLFASAAASAQAEVLPLAVHLAETRDEADLLQTRTGPFRDFLEAVGAWDETGLAESLEHVLALLGSEARLLLIHANYLNPRAVPSSSRVSVVYCPRTHAAFGHAPHPFREFLACGVRVALGTDSLASNPDLDLLAEARYLHRENPDVPGAAVLRMATLSGAEALGWADTCGSLTPGKSADLVVVPLAGASSDPHVGILQSAAAVTRTLWRGRWRAEP
jgi:cytosine/adenosine deaminase-related metal-dependent hydrolase